MNSTPDSIVEYLKSLARQADADTLEESLSRLNVERAAEALASAQQDLYWKHQDIPAMIIVSNAGITHLLERAKCPGDSKEACNPGHDAKALAYNLASFTWPGWDEPGIALRAQDIAVGRRAAELNLRLALELNRPEKAKANAYWMLGAHQLAASEYGPASESFRCGKLCAERADDPLTGAMLDGCLRLTRVLSEQGNQKARGDLDAAVANLREDGSDDADEYANQLTAVLAALERSPGQRSNKSAGRTHQ